ncbi:hypothetical protein ACPCBX_05950 [Streptomyces tuirus]|uniref:Uncharacterized protein n=1 Tax=Streptomyces tuirus TaxID=68278 RepID=A0A7G1N7L3_9ACTN|nr:hypothetical protein [Streptomyces tuirus]BCL18192.1 hypothetical protein GCM10017668_00350 [Streptomyces tuirus]
MPAEGHAFSPVGKFAVDPLPFRERFPSAPVGVRVPVAAILHPAIGPGERTVVEPLTGSREDHAEVVRANVDPRNYHAFLGLAAALCCYKRLIRLTT